MVQMFFGLQSSFRTCFCLRSMASWRDGRDDGPPPWAARQVPSGRTFTALNMSKIQNRDLWKKRMAYVNKAWEKTVLTYNKNKDEYEKQREEDVPKLLVVKLVKSTKGRPKSEKHILMQLGLEERHKQVILKNRESTNAMLKKVKHLLEIFPVTFPYGEPESEADLDHCYLTDNGQLIVKRKLEIAGSEGGSVQLSSQLDQNKFEIKQQLIDRTLELRKTQYQMLREYYQTKYLYEKNQDGKEYRYKGDQRLGYDKIWH